MIPYTYHMVDMGGIDLAEANHTVVEGIFSRIEDALDDTRVIVLYNMFFAKIKIPPSYCNIDVEGGSIYINDSIEISANDEVTVIAIPPPLEPVIPLSVDDNGVYSVDPPQSGYNPVTVALQFTELLATENGEYTPESPSRGFSKAIVNVPQPAPTIQALSVTENGTYTVPSGVDGYSPVTVNVPQLAPTIQALSVTENGTYTVPTGVDGYSPVTVNVQTGEDLSKLAFKSGGNVIFSKGQVHDFTTSASIVRIVNPDNNSDSFLNFSNPFEINIRFKVSAYTSRSQVLCGNTINFYRQPSIEIGSTGSLWCGISSNGSSWTYTLEHVNSVPTDTWCEVNLKYDGSLATLKLTIGETVLSTNASVSSVYDTTSSYCLGGLANSSNHCATNVTIDLTKTYIKINNSLVWGVE